MNLRWCTALVVLASGACGGSDATTLDAAANLADAAPSPAEPDAPPPAAPDAAVVSGRVARIEVTPRSLLLTRAGDTVHLAARAFDEDGRPVAAEVTWRSSDANVVAIDPGGTVTAVAVHGSAQIVAEAAGVSSPSVLALLAQPAPGAILVQDSQVIGVPEPVDLAAPYGVGWRYRVTLSGIALPRPGDLLVGVGETAAGGRVVDAVDNGNTVTVTLEIADLDDLFVDLQIRETIPLSPAAFEIAGDLAATHDVQRLPDGRIRFTPRPGASPKPERRAPSATPSTAPSYDEFSLGPFGCTATGNLSIIPITFLEQAEYTFLPDLSIDLDYDSAAGGLQRLVAHGTLEISVKVAITVNPGFEGKVTCKVKLAEAPLPLPGPIGLALGGKVSLETGFEPSGKVNYSLGLQVTGDLSGDFQIGVDCASGDCQMINELTGQTKDEEFKPIFPDSLSDVNTEMNMKAFLYVGMKAGNPWFAALQFEAFKLEIGPKLRIKLASTAAQAGDPDTASGYQMLLFLAGGAGASLTEFMSFLQLTFLKLETQVEIVIDDSPKGSLTITPATVQSASGSQIGQLATFTVTLDYSTFLGIEVVEGVEILWLRNGVLQPGPPGCTTLAATPGQTTFTCQADFGVEDLGEQTFYAFVKADLFGLPLPVLLEVAGNSAAKVTVTAGAPAVRLTNRSHTMEVGAFFETDPIGTEPNFRELFGQYEGPPGSLETYVDFIAPPVLTVTRDNSGSFDGQTRYMDISFAADADGHLTAINGSADVEAETTLTGCPSDGCAESVFGGRSHASVQTEIVFEVEDTPVSYDLSGALGVDSNDRTAASGVLVLEDLSQGSPLEVFSACSSSGQDACSPTTPATIPLAATGILDPGVYLLSFRLFGQAEAINPDLVEVQVTTHASGSGHFTLTFAPAP